MGEDEFAGAVMGDLNGRRGRIQGMDNKGGKTIIKAEVPMAEMLTYGVDLLRGVMIGVHAFPLTVDLLVLGCFAVVMLAIAVIEFSLMD